MRKVIKKDLNSFNLVAPGTGGGYLLTILLGVIPRVKLPGYNVLQSYIQAKAQ